MVINQKTKQSSAPSSSENVEFRKIGGAPPDLIFYNSNGEIVEKIDLSEKNREECNALLTQRGFPMRVEADSANSHTSDAKGDFQGSAN
uniref:Selenoprotein F/M domain-containing protein n=1 Tax=Strigamia maritima TaxID=126957 RepID=T1J8Y6_STRMM